MKQLKTIVALIAGLFAFTSVQAGEMTVSGSMQATYQSEVDDVTGNPLGMNTDLTFTGSTDTDLGTVTMSLATDGTFLGESGADHTYALATDFGTVTIGNAGDSANAVDDITPTAFEEANGSGSGTYSTDFGSGMDGSMSLKYSNGDLMGTGISVSYSYYPKLDGTTNNEKSASASGNDAVKSAQSMNVGIPFSGLPLIGDSIIGGTKVTLGYEKMDPQATSYQAKEGGTVAVVVPAGKLSLGLQKKAYAPASSADGTKEFYKDEVIGIAYQVNDDFALSYNQYTSVKHANAGADIEQETEAFNVAYTVGGITLGFQDAKTSNAGYSSGTDDDTRTISIKTAF
jgi:hypothetical protein